MVHLEVFIISHFLPAPVGHGGLHRSFQVEHDVEKVAGDGRVARVNLELWRRARQDVESGSHCQRSGLARRLPAVIRKLHEVNRKRASVVENPFRLFGRGRYATAIPFSTSGWVEPEFVDYYRRLVTKEPGPKVCLVEHAVFGDIVELNTRLGIPTVSVFHNLEALDSTRFDWHSRKTVYRVMTDLGNEMRLLGRCADRLFISKVEAGFVGGLGLDCHYYPYLPVGAIRAGLSTVRQRRLAGEAEKGLVVLLGSASRGVTGDSMRWFVDQAIRHGLPAGVRVVGVGSGTDELLPAATTVRGLELKGWIEQAALDTLLARASAALVPQRSGFGALTRLPELACAGVPVIAFSHAAHAVNPTPGLRTVNHDWAAVEQAMQATLGSVDIVSEDDYRCWEAEQPRPLADVLRRHLQSSP